MGISKFAIALVSVVTLNAYAPVSLPQAVQAAEQAHTVDVTEEKIGDKNYQVSKIQVNVKPEHVWRILTDYDNATSIFPCLKKCKLVKDKGASKLVQHQIKPSGVPSTFDYIIEVKEVANRLYEWHRISGDFREVDGFWKLEPTNDGNSTLVTYASYVNGGIFLPAPLIKRQVRMDIPAVMTALKSHAETSRTIAGVTPKIKGN
ncbi:MAG: SRPBCC family protein [Candidatus Obscuribacterales bacterium]|nr:SRPBCC family protein [Candidatus Obscuribacterales bacterium]